MSFKLLALFAFVDDRADISADVFPVEILADRFFSAVGAWVTQIGVVPSYDWYTKWFGYRYFLVLGEDGFCLSDIGRSVGAFKQLNKFRVAELELQGCLDVHGDAIAKFRLGWRVLGRFRCVV